MKLIIVRHGDPDYEHDSLTETGKIEAQCDCNVAVETVKVSEKEKKKEDTV